MKTRNQSIISEKILSTYKDKSYYIITACLRELLLCFHELDGYVKDKDTSNAREILHKMLGPTRMIDNQELEDTISAIQLMIKETDHYSYPDKEISKVDSTLHDLFNTISCERPSINVLVYSQNKEDLDKMEGILLDWDFTNSVTCVQDVKEMCSVAGNSLPDLLIVLDDSQSNEFNESIEIINQRYLGTSVLSWNSKTDLIDRPSLSNFRSSIKKCLNAVTSDQVFQQHISVA